MASLLARMNLAKRPGSLDLGCWTHVASSPFRADYGQPGSYQLAGRVTPDKRLHEVMWPTSYLQADL